MWFYYPKAEESVTKYCPIRQCVDSTDDEIALETRNGCRKYSNCRPDNFCQWDTAYMMKDSSRLIESISTRSVTHYRTGKREGFFEK